MNSKNKQLILLIITIVASLIYIFSANKIVSNGTILNSTGQEYDAYKAKVTEITNIEITEFDFGSNITYGELIDFNVKVLDGDLKGEIIHVQQEISPFFAIQPVAVEEGDKILISQAYVGADLDADFVMLEYSRTDGLMVLMGLFLLGVLWFGKGKGVRTIVSLSLTCASIFAVFIPSILGGYNIYFWAIQTCIFIIIMTMIVVNGFNFKSLSAGLGCIGGILLSGVITVVTSNALKLTGMVEEESVFVQMLNPENPIDLKAIIFAAIIIGAVGAVMDVAVSISSSLYEISEQTEKISFRKLYKSGLNIGKDIMGTMTNTLILAYIGSTLSTVLLLLANTPSLVYLLNTEMIVIELLQSIVGSIGILLALPLTSGVTAYFLTRKH